MFFLTDFVSIQSMRNQFFSQYRTHRANKLLFGIVPSAESAILSAILDRDKRKTACRLDEIASMNALHRRQVMSSR